MIHMDTTGKGDEMAKSKNRLLIILQVADRLQISRSGVCNIKDQRRLRSIKIGAVGRIYDADLESYVLSLISPTEVEA